jgi:phosphoribosylformylglycinamidine synthase
MKTAMAGKLGMSVDMTKIGKDVGRADLALFSESQGRVVVTIDPKNKERFEKLFRGQSYEKVGTVGGEMISVKAGSTSAQVSVKDALTAYTKRFKNW